MTPRRPATSRSRPCPPSKRAEATRYLRNESKNASSTHFLCPNDLADLCEHESKMRSSIHSAPELQTSCCASLLLLLPACNTQKCLSVYNPAKCMYRHGRGAAFISTVRVPPGKAGIGKGRAAEGTRGFPTVCFWGTGEHPVHCRPRRRATMAARSRRASQAMVNTVACLFL